MTALLELLAKTFTNPLVLIMLLIGALFFGVIHEHHVVENLNTKNAANEQVIAANKLALAAKDQSILIQQNDFKAMGDLQKSKAEVNDRQQTLTVKLNAIKDTSTNHPFANPDLLAAGKLMRTYQQSASGSSDTTGTNH